jgi:hypothetical protein
MLGNYTVSPDDDMTVTAHMPESQRRVATDVLTILDETGAGSGADVGDDAELYARYASALAGRQVLIVLDNVPDAEHVKCLLEPGESTCVLVTSRETRTAVYPGAQWDWALDVVGA